MRTSAPSARRSSSPRSRTVARACGRGQGIVFNVVMTWVFNRTGQSLPMAMLLHVSINNFASIAWAEVFPAMDTNVFQHTLLLAAAVAAVVVLAGSRGRLGYRPDDSFT